MGYSEHQRQEMEETIHRATGDLVLIATPVNLGLILNIDKPFRRGGYEVVCRTWQIPARAVAHDPQFCREGSSRPRLVDRYRTAQTSAPVLRSPERAGNPLQRNSRASHPQRSSPGNHARGDRPGLRPHPQGPDLIRVGKIVLYWPTFRPVLVFRFPLFCRDRLPRWSALRFFLRLHLFHAVAPRSRQETSPHNAPLNRLQSTHFCFRLPATFRERAPSRRTPCSLGRKETKSRDHR